MPISRPTLNLPWKRWIEHGQQYMKTSRSLWSLVYAKNSTYPNSTHLSTTSLQSAHMGPLTATTPRLLSIFTLILQRPLLEQATNETIQCRWRLGCLVMTWFSVIRGSCAG